MRHQAADVLAESHRLLAERDEPAPPPALPRPPPQIEIDDPTNGMGRYREESAARAERKAEHLRQQQAKRDADLAAARQHQVAVAKASAPESPISASDLAEVLESIGQGLAGLTDRLEELEQRLDALEGNGETKQLAARLDVITAREDRAVADLRQQVQRLEVDLRLTRVELATMRKTPAEKEIVVVRDAH